MKTASPWKQKILLDKEVVNLKGRKRQQNPFNIKRTVSQASRRSEALHTEKRRRYESARGEEEEEGQHSARQRRKQRKKHWEKKEKGRDVVVSFGRRQEGVKEESRNAVCSV